MSGICGYVGPGRPGVLEAMLEAIDYRGDRTDVAVAPGAGLGYRWWAAAASSIAHGLSGSSRGSSGACARVTG